MTVIQNWPPATLALNAVVIAAGLSGVGAFWWWLVRAVTGRRARGGEIPPGTHRGVPFMLSPGRQITDPDEAEALGLTAEARRMRERRDGREL